MTIDTNIKPYYDDFDATKNYHKILFVPGRPLQAREMTQMQSMIQNQIKATGDFLLKNGSMVIPGHIFFDNTVTSLKLEMTYNGDQVNGYLPSFDGGSIVGAKSGVKAEVISYSLGENNDSPTLYVKFKSGGNAFTSGEVLSLENGLGSTQVQLQNNFSAGAALVTIKEGVYYINGYFVQVLEQKLIVSKYSANPSNIIGLELVEKIVTTKDDNSLFDNSRGFIDYITVGADRYQISLKLVSRPFVTEIVTDSTVEVKFIDLLQIRNGVVLQKKDKSTFGEIEAALARRTYDESGDYTIIPHKISAQHYRSNTRGAWVAGVAYLSGDVVTTPTGKYECLNGNISGTIIPAHTSGIGTDGNLDWLYTTSAYNNLGANVASNAEAYDVATLNDGKINLNISAGKSYVRGFEVDAPAFHLDVLKPRESDTLNSQNLPVDCGLYYVIDSVTGVPDIAALEELTIKNANDTDVGSCRVRNIEPIGNSQYKLYVFDVKFDGTVTYGAHTRDKSRYSDGFKKFVGASFNATGVYTLEPLQGTGNTATTALTGFGTLFTDLSEGDGIKVGTHVSGIAMVNDANSITLATSGPTQTGQIVYRLINRIQGTVAPIVPLPVGFVGTLHPSSTFDTSYVTRRVIDGTTSGTAVTVSLSGGSFDQFGAGSSNYVVIDTLTGVHYTPSAIVLSSGNKTVSLTTAIGDGRAVNIIAYISKANNAAIEKTKLLKVKTVEFTTYNSVKGSALALTEADIQRVVSVKKNGSGTSFDVATPTAVVPFVSAGSIDVTGSFTVDSGITAEYYGIGKLIKNSGVIIDRPIQVTFEYFEHSNGDYFSVDSYRNVPYRMIPNGMADVLDFRPRVADDGSWTGTGKSIPEPISSQQFFSCDISYYLGRRDLVVVRSDSKYEVITGDAAVSPRLPTNVPENSIVIAEINYAPFCANINMVQIEQKFTKRYTMKDIGAIDTRLKDVEYYTALSLLEKKTQEQKITDAFGQDRYKNGFLTDAFERHENGFVDHPDYSNSIDPVAQELRPFFVPNNIKMYEAKPASRGSQGYTVTGDLVTLPYTTTPLVTQLLASKAELINPFAVYGFKGVTTLFPSEDNWIDTQQLPDIQIRKEGSFNTIQSLASKAGILGTQWGAWQETGRTLVGTVGGYNSTRWTLQSQTTSQFTESSAYHSVADWNAAAAWSGWWNGILRRENIQYTNYFSNYLVETTHTDVYGWNVGAQRKGTNSYVAENWDETGRETKIINSTFIPFMRPRPVLVQAKGMKPATNLFLNIDKKQFTNTASILTVVLKETNRVGTFKGYEDTDIINTGGYAREDMWYGNQFYWDRGDVVQFTSGLTCVCVAVDKEEINGVLKTVLKLANFRAQGVSTQTLTTSIATYALLNTNISGTISGASAVVESIRLDAATTNSVGNLWIVAYLTDKTFKCGNIDFIVSDTASADTNSSSTWSKAVYSAQGKLEQKQTTITSVRNGQVITVPVSEATTYYQTTETRQTSATIVSTQETVATNRWFDDPLAQTFSVQDEGGCFITSVDLFFHTTDANIPVIVEMRDVVNGYPGPNILPFAQCVTPGYNINVSTTGLVATKFSFRSPVYIRPGVEYCVAVRCDSNKTKLWVANMGDKDITNPGRIISAQPLTGSLFKSQNNSAWIAEPMEDMTIVIHKAVFNTSTEAEIALFNMPVPFQLLQNNPFSWDAIGSNKVRCWATAHGMKVGDKVNIITNDATASALNNTTVTVTEAGFEYFNFTWPVAYSATAVVAFGGQTFISKNYDANTIRFNANDMAIGGTKIRYAYSVSSGRAMPDLVTCQLNRDITLLSPSEVLSEINSNTFLSSTNVIAGIVNKPLVLDVFMSSTNANISPVLDLQSVSATVIANQINAPSDSLNTGHNNSTVLISQPATFGTNYFETTTTGLFPEFDMFGIGKTITVTGTAAGVTFITNIESTSTIRRIYTDKSDWTTGAKTISVVQGNDFVREIAPVNTSSLFKYVSQPMELATPATSLKVYFDYNIVDAVAGVDVYYKTSKKSLSENLVGKPWIKYTPTSAETLVAVGTPNNFIEASFNIDNGGEFDQSMIKLVGTSSATEIIPRIKNLRIIALA